MFLDSNFNAKLEKIILLNSSLTDWFIKNQAMMAYFEFTHMGCLHFEEKRSTGNKRSMVSQDVRVLGRMAHAVFTWLEGDVLLEGNNEYLNRQEKAFRAAYAIAQIYESEKDTLSEEARELYSIDINVLERSGIKSAPAQKVLLKPNRNKESK